MISDKAKTPSESYVELFHVINTEHLNGYKRLFGGKLMSWIDIAAATVARRHSERNVVTVAIDNINFLTAAYANDLIVITAKLTYAGHTSMEVCTKTYVERFDGTREKINEAYVIMVALDEDDKPTEVPALVPRTDEEREAFEAGRRRKALRKKRRLEHF